MHIKLSKSAEKHLEKLDKPTKQRIRKGILGLTENPPKGDIKPMHGSITENRLRIGKYRIIYEFTKENSINILQVNKIDTRGDVYKK